VYQFPTFLSPEAVFLTVGRVPYPVYEEIRSEEKYQNGGAECWDRPIGCITKVVGEVQGAVTVAEGDAG